MTSQEIEAAVLESLAATSPTRAKPVEFSAHYCGQTSRDGWECDAWRVLFSRGGASFSADFYTGLGHRAEPSKEQKIKARWSFAGLTEKDIRERTIYGRKYLRALEEMRSPTKPHAASVLYSLTLDARAADQSFSDWCSELGYDEDSIKAFDTYRACCDSAKKLREIFTRHEIDALTELLQGY